MLRALLLDLSVEAIKVQVNDGAMTGMQGLATPADLHLTCRPQARLSVISALRVGGICFYKASWSTLDGRARHDAPEPCCRKAVHHIRLGSVVS